MEQCSLTSSFLERVTVPSNLDFTVSHFSPDRRSVTIMFGNALVSLEPAERGQAGTIYNQTAIQTKVITLRIPYATDQPRAMIRLILRGNVGFRAAAGVHVRLVACVGDTTHVVPLPLEKGGDFTESFEITVEPHAAEPVCQLTLILLVEHDIDTDSAGGVALFIDSLDLEMNLDLSMPDRGDVHGMNDGRT